MKTYSTIVDVLRDRAATTPDRLAYSFVSETPTNVTSLTYQQLETKVKAIAAHLQTKIQKGDRILLLFPYSDGLEFVASFYACSYAGAVAVTINPSKNADALDKLLERIEDSQAKAVVTTSEVINYFKGKLAKNPLKSVGVATKFSHLELVEMDKIPLDEATNWQDPEVTADDLAFFQYTSGSTGKPKGVMITQGNLLNNSETIRNAFEYNTESIMGTWLPVFHDMGLIGGIIQPLYTGFPSIMMSPVELIQRPRLWLETISHYKITTSGAPNFAYDLVARQVDPTQLENLDLSSWRLAFSGAETVRAATLKKFTEVFAPFGFKPEYFYPCYGMAEATLFITGGQATKVPNIQYLDPEALQENRAVPSAESELGIVSCGQPWLDDQVAIVNPETKTELEDGKVGEIWACGGGIGQGYWRRPEETAETFKQYLGDRGPFLRTGDLGFVKDGEVYITGRMKEVMILWGRYRYPQNIEATVEKCHPALRPSLGAAFSIEAENDERLVVVHEVERSHIRKLNVEEVVSAIRKAIYEEHSVEVYGIVLIRTATIPKTSSGKIQRRKCRQLYLDGEGLNVVGEWKLEVSESKGITELAGSL
ncbi:Long-chain-fatty-acid--CoA ligase [[Leptolyngbya] sp. PCC 7376]|uniref:fatty acyl-AMP ligase n=1 Tax=[Leptolyngbya] sp. PCC 7376 TaxID=111781 RepID=UPI00029F3816|nr:fatty acyl-AMP ligase [[Leptolyngbya] sp. PCC 7376]AFY38525.1 Long-chain-fatty-acid--CoA ligase [[Leptolyngbya] sp. PCC 7376]